ncbi:CRISPR-associated helicase, Cas3 family [Desulforamulus reducens MI-1]|uniref:CRISPR-associated helicase, Cas3 family n=1 Tax=Desulforamulus reducens (strain ATCC BAA-1160 / DSM 100696 / MI-1) TaxID=349161 RepID=A4J384_DESRM|nr:CRISPR-associated helicase/endonuclease Cas3 [Desulforamulus reducens]ABO49537.1 CRISPR-associated helicase, Cas3 family [Desulforamulus reducens MI-1]
MNYYAHSDKEKDKNQWHLLRDHLQGTGVTASTFAKSFGGETIAHVAGLLHDLGKYSPEFQKRLEGHSIKVDHSTAGAIEGGKRYGLIGKILAYIIAGHHSGLPDWGSVADETSLEARLKKKLYDYMSFSKEINLPVEKDITMPAIRPIVGAGFSVQFLTRLLYACLVDADFLDTERALNPEKAAARVKKYSLKKLSNNLEQYLNNLCTKASDTAINRKRYKILANCREKAECEPGLFTLTVPTGGGKTLSSLSFALRHAIRYEKERIFYVIPFTSIIEQNAMVFKRVIGEENVLEHHSNFAYPQEDQWEMENDLADKLAQQKLATENWDMPVIATTNVQFFESLFAAKSSRCRKIHNLANSVIIIDEAQMIPTGFLKPCLNAVVELVANYHATIVLCTATQPAINKFLPKEIVPVEIIDNPEELYKAFKRVQVHNIGTVSDVELVEKLVSQDQVLCIVNSKKHARILYEGIRGDGTFHLSTRMCPVHRTKVLEMVKERLKEGQVCRVISTQLIEAGVDIDFPVVYRSMAGIDSIAQSAGRCNREGLREMGQVYVFWPEKHGMPRGWLNRTASLGSMVFKRYEDPLGLEGVKAYFTSLYDVDAAELDKKCIMEDIREQERQLRFPFRTIAEKFKLMNDNTSTIVIPWDKYCQKTLAEAESNLFSGSYARKLQRYGVAVYEKEFRELLEFGALEVVGGRFYVLKEDMFDAYYSQETGLKPFTESMFLNDTLII